MIKEINQNDYENEYSGEEIYSKVVRAGKRTYFFDVKATRGDDYFVTITESRKRTMPNGDAHYDKQKIHLYKEDFSKFAEGIEAAVEFIRKAKPEFFEEEA